MPAEPTPSRPSPRTRRLLLPVTMAVVAIVVAVMLLNRESPDDVQRQDQVQAWTADLDTWAEATTERLGPAGTPEAGEHDLAALFEPDWTQPVRYPVQPSTAGWADVDAVNAACTAYTSFIQSGQEAVQPPAPPTGLDTEHPDAGETGQRFGDYQLAVADFQRSTGGIESAVRTFCGTYPALVAAHAGAAEAQADLDEALRCTEAGCAHSPDSATTPGELVELAEAAAAIPNDQIQASLSTQCYLVDLAPVCAADALEAAELARAWRAWDGELTDGGPDDDVAGTETIIGAARADFDATSADLDRAGAGELAQQHLEEFGSTLSGAATELSAALDQAPA